MEKLLIKLFFYQQHFRVLSSLPSTMIFFLEKRRYKFLEAFLLLNKSSLL